MQDDQQQVRDILPAIEKQGERQGSHLNRLAEQVGEVIQSINAMATAIKYGIGAPSKESSNAPQSSNGNTWSMFAIMGTLLVAGLAIGYQSQSRTAAALTEHEQLPLHAGANSRVSILETEVIHLQKNMDATQQSIGLIFERLQ